MALNPEKITFLKQQIQNSEHMTFRSTVTQLFKYISSEIKDNPIYDKFEQDREKWANWPNTSNESSFVYGEWDFPDNI